MDIIRDYLVYLDCKLLRSLLTYIMPLSEFAVHVWSSALKCDKDLLERVQQRACRLIPSM